MRNKAFVLTFLLFVILFSPFFLFLFIRSNHQVSKSKNATAQSSRSSAPSAPMPTLKSGLTQYSFPQNVRGEIYNDGVILFIGYISKKDLTLSGVTTDYLPMGLTQESGTDQPEFVLEEFDIESNLVGYKALNAYDRLSESNKALKYWIFSSKLALQPKTVYWQVKQVSTQKVIWNDNIHVLLLQQNLDMTTKDFFTSATSYDLLKTNIDTIGEQYFNKDTVGVESSLRELKKNVETNISDDAEPPTPLHTTRKEFIVLIDSLIAKIETI